MSVEGTVQTLSDAGVEFVIIGGWSAILHGSALGTTYELDICVSPRADNLRRLVQALAPFHPRSRDLPTGSPFTWDEATLRKGAVLRLVTDIGMIDLVAEVTGLGSFDDVRSGSILVDTKSPQPDQSQTRRGTREGFESTPRTRKPT